MPSKNRKSCRGCRGCRGKTTISATKRPHEALIAKQPLQGLQPLQKTTLTGADTSKQVTLFAVDDASVRTDGQWPPAWAALPDLDTLMRLSRGEEVDGPRPQTERPEVFERMRRFA